MNEFLQERRWLDPQAHKVTLNQDELAKTLISMNSSITQSQGGESHKSGVSDNSEGEAKELAEI